jgi:cysteine synthase
MWYDHSDSRLLQNPELEGASSLRKNDLNSFEGPDSIREFLNPENSPPTPLVELPVRLNPFRADGIRIFAKLAYLSPLLNIKYLPVWNMLIEAENKGRLRGVHTIVENSSGNAAFSLSIMAALFGIPSVVAYVPFDIAPGKLDMLRLTGAQPELKRGAPDEPSGILQAKELGRKEGYFNPSQYENEANPEAYEKWLAPQIWEQTRGKITVFVAGLGTTGTLLGSSRYFRGCPRKVTIVGSMCAPNEAVPGVRSAAKLKEIGLDWSSAADWVVEVRTKESFKHSLELCRSGIVAGPSSGFTIAGLYRFLESSKAASALGKLRNEDGEIIAVFVCGDTPLPYLDKYSTHLEAWEF